MRDKEITLYNKGRVLIKQTIMNVAAEENYFEDISTAYGTYDNTRAYYRSRKWIPTKKTVTEHESPLGFVYTTTEIVEGHWEYANEEKFKNSNKLVNYAKFNIYFGNNKIEIVYPNSYDNKRLDIDTRPWHLVGDDLEDHFVNDLLKVVDELITTIKDAKVNKKPHTHKYNRWSNPAEWQAEPQYDSWSVDDWKQKLYKDLFGNAKGPRYMTNDEKILAHGFDLKTSFRKM